MLCGQSYGNSLHSLHFLSARSSANEQRLKPYEIFSRIVFTVQRKQTRSLRFTCWLRTRHMSNEKDVLIHAQQCSRWQVSGAVPCNRRPGLLNTTVDIVMWRVLYISVTGPRFSQVELRTQRIALNVKFSGGIHFCEERDAAIVHANQQILFFLSCPQRGHRERRWR